MIGILLEHDGINTWYTASVSFSLSKHLIFALDDSILVFRRYEIRTAKRRYKSLFASSISFLVFFPTEFCLIDSKIDVHS